MFRYYINSIHFTISFVSWAMVVGVLLIDRHWSIICDEITVFRGKLITILLAYAERHSMNLTLNFIMILSMGCICTSFTGCCV